MNRMNPTVSIWLLLLFCSNVSLANKDGKPIKKTNEILEQLNATAFSNEKIAEALRAFAKRWKKSAKKIAEYCKSPVIDPFGDFILINECEFELYKLVLQCSPTDKRGSVADFLAECVCECAEVDDGILLAAVKIIILDKHENGLGS